MAQEKSGISISFIDSNSDIGVVRVNSAPVNETDNTLDVLDGLFDTVATAVNAVTRGVEVRQARTYSEGVTGAVRPTDPAIQRETKYVVFGHGADSFRKATLEIPAADTTLADPAIITPSTPGANQYLNLAAGQPGKALKDALDACWTLGPDYDEAVVVDRIELIPRG